MLPALEVIFFNSEYFKLQKQLRRNLRSLRNNYSLTKSSNQNGTPTTGFFH